jgi:hypothetical protein
VGPEKKTEEKSEKGLREGRRLSILAVWFKSS